jgi:YVTN family beta-propeller protein
MQVTPGGEQLWVTNFHVGANPDHAVRVLDPDTLEQLESFTLPGMEQPHGIAMTQDGSRIYVCSILSDNVAIFSTDPPGVIEFGIELPDAGGFVQEPQQCVLSRDESRLFVSALRANKVYVMNTATLAFTAEVTVGLGPWHITLSPSGAELWVANWLGSSVSIVDVSNADAPRVIQTLNPRHPEDPELPVVVRPIGIAFSPDGQRVWVANANDLNQGSGHHPPPDGEKNPGSVTVFDAATRRVLSVAEVPNFARFVSFLP